MTTLRQLLHEVRLATTGHKIRGTPLVNYIFQQYRRHQITDKQHCKANEEMKHLADTYATYLTSQRMWNQVHEEYHAKGERSVADTAKLVGFKLPHDPK